jgi:cell division protein FtsB
MLLLVILVSAVQYDLWYGQTGVFAKQKLSNELRQIQKSNEKAQKRNHKLFQEIGNLKHNDEVIEGLARYELGFIKPNETFYRFRQKNKLDQYFDIRAQKSNNQKSKPEQNPSKTSKASYNE